MRRGAPLAGIALVAGCLHPSSKQCAGGWACPSDLACAPAPTYCGTPSEVSVCDLSTIDGHDACMTQDVPDGVCVAGVCDACTADYEGCKEMAWTPMTNTGPDLNAVWVAGPRDAIAVGNTGAIVYYDGIAWKAQPAAAPDLKGVWQSPGGQIYVIEGMDVQTYTLGGSPTSVQTASHVLAAVWGTADADVIAVGQGGTIDQFDGSAWTETTLGAALLHGIGGTASDVYIVGNVGTVLHRQGTQWVAMTLPSAYSSATLKTVWASSSSDIFVAGATSSTNPPMILHYDGMAWTLSPAESAAMGLNVIALWGSGPSDVFAAGTNTSATAGVVLHYDGTMWKVATTVPDQLTAIGGSTPDDVIAVGQAGTILRYAP